MKKLTIIIAIMAIAGGAYFVLGRGGKGATPTALPAPSIDGGVLKLIDARASSRDFSAREIDDKTLSEILWAAFGKNSRGTRTIPTSRGRQALAVYAITKNGAFLYDGAGLVKKSGDDLRPLFAHTMQSFPKTAPLTILFAGDDAMNSPIHAGAAMQNVGLYAAEKGMGAVVRMMFDKDAAKKALAMPKAEQPIVSITIGWVK
ncbi:MAG: nitroreductase family protein [Rickettsiales bacterium]|nr:nitroreductase family protein [Rickettsiales bacterium]